VCRDVAGSIALNYEVEKIQAEELQRETEIKERIYRRISTFTEKPVVFFELESPYFDFEDSDIRPMDTLGTLYMAMRISDNWGKLSVDEGGCLVSNNLRYLRVTAKGYKFEKNRAEGEGWHLTLNDGWELTPVNGNYFVRKLVP
jgi:arginine deiminase